MRILVLNPGSSSHKVSLYEIGNAIPAEMDAVGHRVVHGDPRFHDPIRISSNVAPGNHAPICGLKVVANSGWFVARPSGTENIYRIYAESVEDEPHLIGIFSEAQEIVSNALGQS